MPKGINGLRNSVQPMTGNASIEAAMLALSPEEQALVAQGIDPFGGDAGGAGGMYKTPAGPVDVNAALATAQNARALEPQQKAELMTVLSEILASIGTPTDAESAAVSSSIQNAIRALGAGGM